MTSTWFTWHHSRGSDSWSGLLSHKWRVPLNSSVLLTYCLKYQTTHTVLSDGNTPKTISLRWFLGVEVLRGQLTPLCVDSARALWAFTQRLTCKCVYLCVYMLNQLQDQRRIKVLNINWFCLMPVHTCVAECVCNVEKGEGGHPFLFCLWGYTSGGVYVPCIYTHTRWELP